MGTKGRDACLWLFLAVFLAAMITRGGIRTAFFAALVCIASSYLYYIAWYQTGARRRSREMHLRMTVLLPVNTLWARILLARNLRTGFKRAFEVHLSEEKHALVEYMRLLTHDLEIVQEMFPGAVFMWETSVPLPLFVRRLVRSGSENGTAFLKDGGWPVPRFPLTGKALKRGRVRHGAIIA